MVTRASTAIGGDGGSTWLGQFSGNWREDYLESTQPTTDFLALLQYLGMGLPVVTTVSSTEVFTEAWESLRTVDVTTSGVIPGGRPLSELGWSLEEALETRMRLRTFEEDWNAPGMDAYDEL